MGQVFIIQLFFILSYIYYIILCYLSLAFVRDVCGIFCGMCYQSATDIPFFTIHIYAVLSISLHISAIFARF